MNRRCLFVVGGAGLALAAGLGVPAAADELQTYTYDARGRLVAVVSTGSVNHNRTRSYCYDKPDNRTNYISDVSGVPAVCTVTTTPPPPDPPSNNPPVTTADSISVPCNSVTSVNVTANDTDPEGNYPLTVTGVTTPLNGAQAYVESASSIEVWGASSAGAATVTYTVKDSLDASSTGSLTINSTGNGTICD